MFGYHRKSKCCPAHLTMDEPCCGFFGSSQEQIKERGRFSLRFNIGDPVQRTAVELLELQPPHSKSQYIANALAYYNANFADDPQPVKVAPPVIDRTTIEAIVREIMRQETQHSNVSSDKRVGSKTEPVLPSIQQPAPDYELQQGE